MHVIRIVSLGVILGLGLHHLVKAMENPWFVNITLTALFITGVLIVLYNMYNYPWSGTPSVVIPTAAPAHPAPSAITAIAPPSATRKGTKKMNRSKGLNLATQKDRSSFFFWPLAVLAGAMLLVPLAAYLSGRFPFGPVQVTDKLILGPEFFIPVYALALFGVQHLMWLCRKPGVQADDPVDLGLSLAPAGLAALWVVAVAGFTVTGKNMLGLTSFEFVVNNVTFELTIWLIFETLLDLKFHFFARPLELTARAKKASAEAVEKLKAPPADDDFMMSLFDAAPDGVNEIGPLRVTYTLKADGTIEDYIDDTDVAETLAKFRSKDPTAATA